MKIPNFATSGSVVQLDRMTDSGSVGWGFESLRSHAKKVNFSDTCRTNRPFGHYNFGQRLHCRNKDIGTKH